MIPHHNGNSMGPSWTISTVTFTGGLLWTGHEEGSTSPPCEAKGMDASVRGKGFVTKSKWH
eukprot:12912125-Prorocentrum_lima.AAC.1